MPINYKMFFNPKKIANSKHNGKPFIIHPKEWIKLKPESEGIGTDSHSSGGKMQIDSNSVLV